MYDVASDANGLSRDNSYLVVYIPPTNNALVFRVKGKANARYTMFDYGLLPTTTSTVCTGFTTQGSAGGTATVAAAGQITANAYTPNLQFAATQSYSTYDTTDMWYYPEDYRDRLFEVKTLLTPAYLRVDANIPTNVVEQGFQRNRVAGGVPQDFGYKRGVYQVVHLPRLHYGYQFGNDTNLTPYCRARFIYGEYLVEIPKNPDTIFSLLSRDGRYPCRWVDLPVVTNDPTLQDSLNRSYGYQGFPVMGLDQKTQALQTYAQLVKDVLI